MCDVESECVVRERECCVWFVCESQFVMREREEKW